MRHLKELDSIRALAIFLVIISHWLEDSYFAKTFHPGQVGVDAFFVLSGFLITGILLQNRARAESAGHSKMTVVKNFFIRRSLRVFPIYYATILVLLAFGDATGTRIRESFGYFFTYTSNFYFYNTQSWDGMVSPLWSLAVEEQFYLLWPWVILFVPKKHLLASLIAFVGIGVISSYVLSVQHADAFAFVLPFTCFDAFGLGALLSFVLVFHKDKLEKCQRILSLVATLCCLLLLGSLAQWWPQLLPVRTVHSLVALWLVARIVLNQEQHRPQPWPLNTRALAFVGKISYGMYLFHVPLGYDGQFVYEHFNYWLPNSLLKYHIGIVFVQNFALLTLLAWISWVVLERPVLGLKRYFDYQEAEPPRVQKV